MDLDAENVALQQVAAMLQRPDQLEKLPELKKRADRKKAAVEAMLRTGVQSQLEGVRTALAHLHTASEDISAIQGGIDSIFDRLKPFPALKEGMHSLRDANAKHGQYSAAIENLNHILKMEETVHFASNAIEDNKLLIAHKHIMDLERARDELLMEVHRMNLPNKEYEIKLLTTYFKSVQQLADKLWKEMELFLKRALEMARGSETGQGPKELVSCLRIVEREERIDKYYIDRRTVNNSFMPPGRPRCWRRRTFELLEERVRERVEGNQIEERESHKAWLARHLEVCRNIVVDDLVLARAVGACFPPEYQMYDRYVQMYHNCLCNRVREIASDQNLDKKEVVQLMSWVNAYGSTSMLGDPRLQITVGPLLQDVPILPKSTLYQLCDTFITMTKEDFKGWLNKTLNAEKDDWYNKVVGPEEDNNGYYYTTLPNIIFGMLRDTVTLAKEVSTDLIPSVINVAVQEFYDFAARYRDAFTAYKNKYFELRDRAMPFTRIIISIANNLYTCIDATERYMQQVRLSMEANEEGGYRRGPSRQTVIENIEKLGNRWNEEISIVVSFLLDEICVDISAHLTGLGTKRTDTSNHMEVIALTIDDYINDYQHLKPGARAALFNDLHFRIAAEYFRGFDSRRITFGSYAERREFCNKVSSEIYRMEELYDRIWADPSLNEERIDMCPLLRLVLTLLQSEDTSLLTLEMASFCRQYPNIPLELLVSIVSSRENVNRSEAKSLAEDSLKHVTHHPRNKLYEQFFSQCQQDSGWIPPVVVANVLPSFMRKS